MRRRIGGLVLLSGMLAFSGGAAWGGDSLRVRMPFAFGAGGTEFPKGDCNIDISRPAKVSISCSRSRAVVQASTLAFTGSVYEVSDRKEIIFTRYGDTYFLFRVYIADEGREISRSDEEKALVNEGVEGTPVTLKVK